MRVLGGGRVELVREAENSSEEPISAMAAAREEAQLTATAAPLQPSYETAKRQTKHILPFVILQNPV